MALYYLVPRFPTATFDLCSRLGVITSECVVPENIHTHPTPPPSHTHTHTHTQGGQRKFRGAGDPKGGNFLRGGGGGGGGGDPKGGISGGGGGGGGGGWLLESSRRGLRVRSMSC